MFRRALEKLGKGKGKENQTEVPKLDHQRRSFDLEEQQTQQQRLEEEERWKRKERALYPIKTQIRKSRYTNNSDVLECLLIDT